MAPKIVLLFGCINIFFLGRERRNSSVGIRRASTPVNIKVNDKEVEFKKNGVKGLKIS